MTWTTPPHIVLNNQSPTNFQLPDVSQPSGSSNHLQETYQIPYSVRTASVRQQEHKPCSLSQKCFLTPSSHKTNSHFSLRRELWGNLMHGSPSSLPFSPGKSSSWVILQSHWRPWLHDPCHSYICLYQAFINSYILHWNMSSQQTGSAFENHSVSGGCCCGQHMQCVQINTSKQDFSSPETPKMKYFFLSTLNQN